MRPAQAPGAGSDERHEHVRTSCGRDVTVGRLALGDAHHPTERIFVDLGECARGNSSGWAGLTLAEARQLAQAILSQVAGAERDCHGSAPAR
jgi:hypothetical protein